MGMEGEGEYVLDGCVGLWVWVGVDGCDGCDGYI